MKTQGQDGPRATIQEAKSLTYILNFSQWVLNAFAKQIKEHLPAGLFYKIKSKILPPLKISISY